MALEGRDAIHLRKRRRQLISGLRTSNGESSGTDWQWHPSPVVTSLVHRKSKGKRGFV